MQLKTGLTLKGRYRFIKKNSKTGEVICTSPWIKNLIMLSDTLGLNLIIRRLGNDLTYDCIITSAEIGTGTTAPTNSDANLETPVVTGVIPADQTVGVDNVMVAFFIPNVNLANGTYNEFGIRCGTQMFARSIISPAFVKGTNEDTTVEYIIEANNT